METVLSPKELGPDIKPSSFVVLAVRDSLCRGFNGHSWFSENSSEPSLSVPFSSSYLSLSSASQHKILFFSFSFKILELSFFFVTASSIHLRQGMKWNHQTLSCPSGDVSLSCVLLSPSSLSRDFPFHLWVFSFFVHRLPASSVLSTSLVSYASLLLSWKTPTPMAPYFIQ